MTAGTGPVARSTAALADDAAAAFDGSSTVLEIARQLSLRSVQVAQLWSDAEIEFPDSPEASSSVWRAAVQRLFDPAALSAAGVPAVDANMAMAGLIYLHGPLYESVRDRWFDFASHLAVKPEGGWAGTRAIPTGAAVFDLLFTHRNRIATAGGRGGVSVWDLTGQTRTHGDGNDEDPVAFPTYALAKFAGGIVAVGNAGGVVFREATGVQVVDGPYGAGTNWNSCAVGRGGSEGLIIGSSSGLLVVVDDLRAIRTPRISTEVDRNAINGLAVIGDAGDRIALATSSDLRIWIPSLNEISRILDTGETGCSDVAVSPDQRVLAAACGDGTVRLWNLGSWGDPADLRAVLRGHRGPVLAVAFSRSGKLLASGGADGTVRVWSIDKQTVTEIRPDHSMHVTCVAFSPDGAWLASGGWDGMIRIEPTPTLPVEAPPAQKPAPSGQLAAAKPDKTHDWWAFIEALAANAVVSLAPLLLVGIAVLTPTAPWVRVTCVALLITTLIALFILARQRQHGLARRWPLITALLTAGCAIVVLALGAIIS